MLNLNSSLKVEDDVGVEWWRVGTRYLRLAGRSRGCRQRDLASWRDQCTGYFARLRPLFDRRIFKVRRSFHSATPQPRSSHVAEAWCDVSLLQAAALPTADTVDYSSSSRPLHFLNANTSRLLIMVRFRDVPRSAAFAWSPDAAQPKIATGTKAGALDIDFSSATVLDLWELTPSTSNPSDELRPHATLPVDSR